MHEIRLNLWYNQWCRRFVLNALVHSTSVNAKVLAEYWEVMVQGRRENMEIVHYTAHTHTQNRWGGTPCSTMYSHWSVNETGSSHADGSIQRSKNKKDLPLACNALLNRKICSTFWIFSQFWYLSLRFASYSVPIRKWTDMKSDLCFQNRSCSLE